MKFKLKAVKKQPEKDFIGEIQHNINEVEKMLKEARGIKEVLRKYEQREREKKHFLAVEYKEDYLSGYIVRIKMDDLMVEYLKDRLAQIEKEIKERVVSND